MSKPGDEFVCCLQFDRHAHTVFEEQKKTTTFIYWVFLFLVVKIESNQKSKQEKTCKTKC